MALQSNRQAKAFAAVGPFRRARQLLHRLLSELKGDHGGEYSAFQ
jgi:hypothetical protein